MADYPSTSKTKRSSAVKIMLHPEMAEKLRVLAEHLGQTPSTLASLAVSQYVAQQTVALGATERALNGFFEQLGPGVQEMLEKLAGGGKNALLEAAGIDATKALPQTKNALLEAATKGSS